MITNANSNFQSKVQRVLIVGATHGNEFIGAYLIKKFEQYPALIQRLTFETLTLLANPQAFARTRRHIDTDLNRCFRQEDLQDLTRSTYEAIRAIQVICETLKPSQVPPELPSAPKPSQNQLTCPAGSQDVTPEASKSSSASP